MENVSSPVAPNKPRGACAVPQCRSLRFRLLFLENFSQQLKGIPFCLFRGLADSIGRLLECLIGHVPRIAHVVVGFPVSPVQPGSGSVST